MKRVACACLVVLGLAWMPATASAGTGKCYGLKDADQKNLCLAKATGDGAMYCGKIKGADLKKFCEATVQYRSRSMCSFIKNSTLRKQCEAELK